MKNKIGKLLIGITASVCSILAISTSASACWFCFYQPEEPEALQEIVNG